MKKLKAFRYCEYCDKAYEDIFPPINSQYKQGLIHLGEFSSVLLDNLSSKKSHFANLEGIYCNIDCLVKYIKKVRGEIEKAIPTKPKRKMKFKRKFKIGDRVEGTENGLEFYVPWGIKGTIIEIKDNAAYPVGVEFDRKLWNGHSCGGKGKDGYCRYCRYGKEFELELIRKEG